MKTTTQKISAILLVLLSSLASQAQPRVTFYTDSGNSNASFGPYMKVSAIACYMTDKTRIETGIQTDILKEVRLSGFTMNASRIYRIKNLICGNRGIHNPDKSVRHTAGD